MHRLLTVIILWLPVFAFSQKQARFINEGNEYFKNGQLLEAVTAYNKVTDEKYKYTALLNKGTALYKLKKYDEAINAYQQVSRAAGADAILRSGAYYNTGVVYSNQNKLQESIAAYKSALRLNWKDNDARENLQKALSQLRKNNGGGGGEQKPQQAKSKFNQQQAQQQLNRLEQKEKNTQDKVSNKKTQYSGSNGKDW
ncbi:MAG: tetratricopeptide repeat protein [Niabella sp.]